MKSRSIGGVAGAVGNVGGTAGTGAALGTDAAGGTAGAGSWIGVGTSGARAIGADVGALGATAAGERAAGVSDVDNGEGVGAKAAGALAIGASDVGNGSRGAKSADDASKAGTDVALEAAVEIGAGDDAADACAADLSDSGSGSSDRGAKAAGDASNAGAAVVLEAGVAIGVGINGARAMGAAARVGDAAGDGDADGDGVGASAAGVLAERAIGAGAVDPARAEIGVGFEVAAGDGVTLFADVARCLAARAAVKRAARSAGGSDENEAERTSACAAGADDTVLDAGAEILRALVAGAAASGIGAEERDELVDGEIGVGFLSDAVKVLAADVLGDVTVDEGFCAEADDLLAVGSSNDGAATFAGAAVSEGAEADEVGALSSSASGKSMSSIGSRSLVGDAVDEEPDVEVPSEVAPPAEPDAAADAEVVVAASGPLAVAEEVWPEVEGAPAIGAAGEDVEGKAACECPADSSNSGNGSRGKSSLAGDAFGVFVDEELTADPDAEVPVLPALGADGVPSRRLVTSTSVPSSGNSGRSERSRSRATLAAVAGRPDASDAEGTSGPDSLRGSKGTRDAASIAAYRAPSPGGHRGLRLTERGARQLGSGRKV